MEFTIIDGVVGVVVIISAVLAFSRGFVRETLTIVGWVAAAVVAYIFAPQAEPLMKEVPILSDVISGSCEISMITAFAAVFAVALIVASIFTPLFSSLVQRSAVGGIDSALGFLFGALRGLLIVAIAFIVYDRAIVGESYAMVDDSQSAKIFADLQDRLTQQIPAEVPGWVTEKYEDLLGNCGSSRPVQPVTPEPAAPAEGEAAPAGN